MVVIRLARSGSKKKPFYHLVAADRRCRRDGRFIEKLGYFCPTARGQQVRLHLESDRIEHWIAQGAQTSDRVQRLIKEHALGAEKVAAKRQEKTAKAQAKKAAAKKAEATAEADS